MVRNSRDVTEAELNVLQVLWSQGPLTIRGITEILEPKRVDAYYSTVKKLLERLETKGFVQREAAGIGFIYAGGGGNALRRFIDAAPDSTGTAPGSE